MRPIGGTDNRLVENINEKCRPSNIAQLYNTLESQEWVDAKETLEDITDFREEDILRFLCACVLVRRRFSILYNFKRWKRYIREIRQMQCHKEK